MSASACPGFRRVGPIGAVPAVIVRIAEGLDLNAVEVGVLRSQRGVTSDRVHHIRCWAGYGYATNPDPCTDVEQRTDELATIDPYGQDGRVDWS